MMQRPSWGLPYQSHSTHTSFVGWKAKMLPDKVPRENQEQPMQPPRERQKGRSEAELLRRAEDTHRHEEKFIKQTPARQRKSREKKASFSDMGPPDKNETGPPSMGPGFTRSDISVS